MYAVSVGLTEEVKSQKAPYWVCRMKAMRLSRASVADVVGGQSVAKEKPKRCCYEVMSCVRTAIGLKCRAEEGWKHNSGSHAQSAGSISRPLLPSSLCHCSLSMGMHLVPRVLLSSRSCPYQENVSISLPMLALTRKAHNLRYILQTAGDSPASLVHSNCDGHRCSLCADVKIQQGACHEGRNTCDVHSRTVLFDFGRDYVRWYLIMVSYSASPWRTDHSTNLECIENSLLRFGVHALLARTVVSVPERRR